MIWLLSGLVAIASFVSMAWYQRERDKLMEATIRLHLYAGR